MRTIAVIQARMGSTRLPGKILEPIEGRPLLAWTVAAVRAVPEVDDVVLATSDRPEDDAVLEAMRDLDVRVHRGSVHDVLRRVADAVRALEPDVVLRQTGDNPFVDPEVMSAQLVRLDEGPFDYVGIAGLPLGIGGEAGRGRALLISRLGTAEPGRPGHRLPLVPSPPPRLCLPALSQPPPWRPPRFTVHKPA